MTDSAQSYIDSLLQAYLALPDTPARYTQSDRLLADHLFQSNIPLLRLEAAFALASLRRSTRNADALPLAPIRSLHYFLPILDELNSAPDSYLKYCSAKFLSFSKQHALL